MENVQGEGVRFLELVHPALVPRELLDQVEGLDVDAYLVQMAKVPSGGRTWAALIKDAKGVLAMLVCHYAKTHNTVVADTFVIDKDHRGDLGLLSFSGQVFRQLLIQLAGECGARTLRVPTAHPKGIRKLFGDDLKVVETILELDLRGE